MVLKSSIHSLFRDKNKRRHSYTVALIGFHLHGMMHPCGRIKRAQLEHYWVHSVSVVRAMYPWHGWATRLRSLVSTTQRKLRPRRPSSLSVWARTSLGYSWRHECPDSIVRHWYGHYWKYVSKVDNGIGAPPGIWQCGTTTARRYLARSALLVPWTKKCVPVLISSFHSSYFAISRGTIASILHLPQHCSYRTIPPLTFRKRPRPCQHFLFSPGFAATVLRANRTRENQRLIPMLCLSIPKFPTLPIQVWSPSTVGITTTMLLRIRITLAIILYLRVSNLRRNLSQGWVARSDGWVERKGSLRSFSNQITWRNNGDPVTELESITPKSRIDKEHDNSGTSTGAAAACGNRRDLRNLNQGGTCSSGIRAQIPDPCTPNNHTSIPTNIEKIALDVISIPKRQLPSSLFYKMWPDVIMPTAIWIVFTFLIWIGEQKWNQKILEIITRRWVRWRIDQTERKTKNTCMRTRIANLMEISQRVN